jgi:hypothetical protein
MSAIYSPDGEKYSDEHPDEEKYAKEYGALMR